MWALVERIYKRNHFSGSIHIGSIHIVCAELYSYLLLQIQDSEVQMEIHQDNEGAHRPAEWKLSAWSVGYLVARRKGNQDEQLVSSQEELARVLWWIGQRPIRANWQWP